MGALRQVAHSPFCGEGLSSGRSRRGSADLPGRFGRVPEGPKTPPRAPKVQRENSETPGDCEAVPSHEAPANANALPRRRIHPTRLAGLRLRLVRTRRDPPGSRHLHVAVLACLFHRGLAKGDRPRAREILGRRDAAGSDRGLQLDGEIGVFRFHQFRRRLEHTRGDGRVRSRFDQDERAGQPVAGVAVEDQWPARCASAPRRCHSWPVQPVRNRNQSCECPAGYRAA